MGIGSQDPIPMPLSATPSSYDTRSLDGYKINKMPTSHYIVQPYMDAAGLTGVRYFEVLYAIGSNSDPVPMKIDTLADDDDYECCPTCWLYVYKSPVAKKRHQKIHEDSERLKTSLEMRPVHDKDGKPVINVDGRIEYYFGAYIDVATGRAVKTETGYKEIYRSENLMSDVKGPAANTDINGPCQCLSCVVTYQPTSDVGPVVEIPIVSRGLGKPAPGDVIIDDAFDLRILEPRDDLGDLPTIEDSDLPPIKIIRFARSVTFDGNQGKRFEVEFRNQLTEFNLVDGDQGELETIDRFRRNKSDLTSSHRIYTSDETVITIDVDWQGKVTQASVATQVPQDDGTRQDTFAYVDEFFIPANHVFLRHVNIQTVMKGLV